MFIVFCFKWGFGVNLHVNISLFRITIYLSWFEIFRFIKWGFPTLDDHQAPNAIVWKQKPTQKFLFLNCKSVEMKLCLKLHCSLCVLIIPTNIDGFLGVLFNETYFFWWSCFKECIFWPAMPLPLCFWFGRTSS